MDAVFSYIGKIEYLMNGKPMTFSIVGNKRMLDAKKMIEEQLKQMQTWEGFELVRCSIQPREEDEDGNIKAEYHYPRYKGNIDGSTDAYIIGRNY